MSPASASPIPASGPEEPLWQGRPSQWTNFIPFILCILIIPIPWAFYRWLVTNCTSYSITTQRLRKSSGILTKHFDDLELYRVKDSTVTQPFWLRMVGLGNITLHTSDTTTPTLVLPAIKDPLAVHDLLRQEIERLRRERGVRELDVHDHDVSGSPF